MQFQLSGHQIEVTQSLRDHVASKLDRLTRLDERLTSIAVVLSLDNHHHIAEATLNATGARLHAESNEDDMYVSIDVMFDKLFTQLRKHREKVCDKHKQEVRAERQYA